MDFNDYIKTYEDLAEQVGNMVLSNEVINRPLELINGDLEDEIFQYYIISDPDFLLEHTDEIIFYDTELNLHVWGVTHFAMAWSGVSVPELH